MEQHPVPRNISGFQFKLIGDMTLRQFGYIAVGALCGYIFFKLTLFPVIITYPLAAIFFLGGFAVAFLPIQDRPLDKWLVDFIKSITSPTQYLWIKNEEPPAILLRVVATTQASSPEAQNHVQIHHESNLKLKAYLATLPVTTQQVVNNKEKQYIDQTLLMFGNYSSSTVPPLNSTSSLPLLPKDSSTRLSQMPTQPIPKIPNLTPAQAASVQTTPIASTPVIHPPHLSDIKSTPIISAPAPQAAISPIPPPPPPPTPVVAPPNPDDKFKQLQKEKEDLAKELEILKRRMETEKTTVVVKPQIVAENEQSVSGVTKVSAKSAVDTVGIPSLPEYPNVVIGVVKDPQKKVMPNVILTIKDAMGTPVRALKTNKLGQFATATSLQNGNYVLELEDPMKRFVFDNVAISLNGTTFLPVEIIAKGQREIARDQLNKAIFGDAAANITTSGLT